MTSILALAGVAVLQRASTGAQVSQQHVDTTGYAGVNPGLRRVGTQVRLSWGSGYEGVGLHAEDGLGQKGNREEGLGRLQKRRRCQSGLRTEE
jgi:hypothetical protein